MLLILMLRLLLALLLLLQLLRVGKGIEFLFQHPLTAVLKITLEARGDFVVVEKGVLSGLPRIQRVR